MRLSVYRREDQVDSSSSPCGEKLIKLEGPITSLVRGRGLHDRFSILCNTAIEKFQVVCTSRCSVSIVENDRVVFLDQARCAPALRRSSRRNFAPVAASYPKGCGFEVIRRQGHRSAVSAPRSTHRHRSSERPWIPTRSARTRCCPSNNSNPLPSTCVDRPLERYCLRGP